MDNLIKGTMKDVCGIQLRYDTLITSYMIHEKIPHDKLSCEKCKNIENEKCTLKETFGKFYKILYDIHFPHNEQPCHVCDRFDKYKDDHIEFFKNSADIISEIASSKSTVNTNESLNDNIKTIHMWFNNVFKNMKKHKNRCRNRRSCQQCKEINEYQKLCVDTMVPIHEQKYNSHIKKKSCLKKENKPCKVCDVYEKYKDDMLGFLSNLGIILKYDMEYK